MPRIRKPDSEKTKSFMKRAGWMLLVILFVTTSLGVGVAAFWQATHQPDSSTSQTTPPPPAANNSCAGGTEANQEKLALPEVYKPSGKVDQLQATDLQEGIGPAAKTGDCLVMKYYGTLASNGTKFDENYDTPNGFRFKLGAGEVIQGWDQGLVGIKAGGTRRLVIPASLGYGSQGSGSIIPPNSDLVFVVKLESIKQ
jgi:FKBP-type peptidyl-prolyl cis-trans isomerase FkpA